MEKQSLQKDKLFNNCTEEQMHKKKLLIIVGLIVIIPTFCICSILAGLSVMGVKKAQDNLKDEQRREHVHSLQLILVDYYIYQELHPSTFADKIPDCSEDNIEIGTGRDSLDLASITGTEINKIIDPEYGTVEKTGYLLCKTDEEGITIISEYYSTSPKFTGSAPLQRKKTNYTES